MLSASILSWSVMDWPIELLAWWRQDGTEFRKANFGRPFLAHRLRCEAFALVCLVASHLGVWLRGSLVNRLSGGNNAYHPPATHYFWRHRRRSRRSRRCCRGQHFALDFSRNPRGRFSIVA